jgi:hypothetical protein
VHAGLVKPSLGEANQGGVQDLSVPVWAGFYLGLRHKVRKMNERSFIVKSLYEFSDFGEQAPRAGSKPAARRLSSRFPIQGRYHLMMRRVESRLQSESLSIDRQPIWLLGKLPDRNNRAQTDKRVNDSFHDATALLFRANQERVCRFMFVVHNMRPSFMMKTPPASRFVYMPVVVHR